MPASTQRFWIALWLACAIGGPPGAEGVPAAEIGDAIAGLEADENAGREAAVERAVAIGAAAIDPVQHLAATSERPETQDACRRVLDGIAAAAVEQLGASEFNDREQASEDLIRIGLPALPALKEGEKQIDREIRFRCRRLITTIQDRDFERRLTAFAEGRDGERGEPPLPGWNRFRELAGEDRPARDLFVEMLRGDRESLAAIEQGRQAAADALAGRSLQLQLAAQYGDVVSVGEVAALLLLAADEKVNISPQAGAALYSFCYQAAFAGEVTTGNRAEMLKTLLGAWIARADESTAYQGLSLAMRYDIPAGLTSAEKLLAGNAQPHVRQYAILAVAKLGSDRQIPLLEKLLDDQSLIARPRINNKTYETQLRDVALAALVKLAGLNHKEYGFERIQTHPQMVFNTATLGFEDDAKRQQAIGRWREHQASAAEAGTN